MSKTISKNGVMRLLKILIINAALWPPAIYMKGSKSIWNLQKEISKHGIEVHILTCIQHWVDPSWKEWLKSESNIMIHTIDLSIYGHYLSKFLYNLFLIFKIYKLQKKYNYDIIHEYLSFPLFMIRLGVIGKMFKIKTILTLSTFHQYVVYGKNSILLGARLIDAIICTTKNIYAIMQKKRVNKTKLYYIPLGVTIPKYSFRDSLSLKKDLEIKDTNIVIMYLGPLDKNKGYDVLVSSSKSIIKKNPHAIFLFVINNMKNDVLYNRKKEKLVDSFQSRQENFRMLEGIYNIGNLMDLADIFVLPNIHAHGTLGHPLTLTEAMRLKKAIVASNIAGVNELIDHKKNGLLFKNNDHLDLSRKINQLIMKPDERLRLSERAYETSLKYNMEFVTKIIIELYDFYIKST